MFFSCLPKTAHCPVSLRWLLREIICHSVCQLKFFCTYRQSEYNLRGNLMENLPTFFNTSDTTLSMSKKYDWSAIASSLFLQPRCQRFKKIPVSFQRFPVLLTLLSMFIGNIIQNETHRLLLINYSNSEKFNTELLLENDSKFSKKYC